VARYPVLRSAASPLASTRNTSGGAAVMILPTAVVPSA
jgi:hypothetical protein